jgi:hypothetical protein
MNLRKQFLILSIFIIFIFACGTFTASNLDNSEDLHVTSDFSNQTDVFGCCSIVLQLDGNDTMMSYRRDSNVTADVYIEKVNWHGIPAIKQYKEEYGYFNHVIVTNNGWVIGLGGIDDGKDSEICENITAGMINDDYIISERALAKIQDIKKPYGRGHVVIKAPNGNYGFANVDKLKTGTLKPGQYISIPNNYSLSRSGNLSLNSTDLVGEMTKLSQLDKYGLDRREIVTYDFKTTEKGNITGIYVSNEDGSQVGANYTGCIDDIHFNNTVIKGSDIPIGPNYKSLGSIEFTGELTTASKGTVLMVLIAFVIFVALLFFVVLKFVRFIRHKIRRRF